MSPSTAQHHYTIKEAAALTGLPASTLRYYESIGVIAPVSRGASSGHRIYDEGDLDQLMWIACLAATGMSVAAMKQYVRIKIDYWKAVEAGDGVRAEELSGEARALADELKRAGTP